MSISVNATLAQWVWRRVISPLSAGRYVLAFSLALCAASDSYATEGPKGLETAQSSSSESIADKINSSKQAALGSSRLSATDIQRYRRIFLLQESGNWEQADKLIAELDDPILLGHVEFQRYMHPTAYRSKFSELSGWMEKYADHPDAARIYRLAVRRKPARAKTPPKPERRLWRYGERPRSAFEVHNRKRSAAQVRQRGRIERHVRSLLRRERPTQSLGYLESAPVQKALTALEKDRIRQWIATSYYVEQKDDRAYEVAAEVAKRNRAGVPLADWIAGLAAWRQGKIELAGTHFETLALAKHVDGWDRSAAAYWAARAFLKTRRPEKVLPMLRIAADEPLSFYGLLARQQLGRPIDPGWTAPDPQYDTLREIAAYPAVRRAIALAEIGRKDLAETELVWAHGRLEDRHDPALLAIASSLRLPHVEWRIAVNSETEGLHAGLYPLPDWQPVGGYQLDRGLVFAIARRESKFLETALSRAGARGLLQVLPLTAQDVTGDRRYRGSRRKDLFDPAVNLQIGQTYAKRLLDAQEPKGNLLKFLSAYNAGPGNLRRWLGVVQYQDDPLLFLESFPARETRTYVEKVMAGLWLYRTRLNQPAPSLQALAEGKWPLYVPLEDPASRGRVAALEDAATAAGAASGSGL